MANAPIVEIARACVEDPEYRTTLTEQIKARTADPQLIERLIVYARGRQATSGQAMVRRILTEAGVSWESL